MLKKTLLAAVAAVVLAGAAPASAQQVVCNKRSVILEGFAKTYHEVPSAIGITDAGGLIETLASPSGSWTMIATKPGGITCIIGTGHDWFVRPPAGKEQPAVYDPSTQNTLFH